MAAPCIPASIYFSISMLFIFNAFDSLQIVKSDKGNRATSGDGFFLCRKCGYEVAQSKDLLILPTHKALKHRNDTVADKTKLFIQLFQNPHGAFFEVITTSTATVQRANDKHAADTWFPGYMWSLIFCSRCGHHLGWWFDAMSKSFDTLHFKVSNFVGLILDHIIHEDEESNLIVVPKSHMS